MLERFPKISRVSRLLVSAAYDDLQGHAAPARFGDRGRLLCNPGLAAIRSSRGEWVGLPKRAQAMIVGASVSTRNSGNR
jgi:hypothetical protein